MLNTLHAIVLLAAGLVVGGQTFGSLSGTVTDPLGGVLPAANVTLTQAARQARYEVRTDAQGRFELPGLVPGDYQIEIDVPGFEHYVAGVAIGGEAIQRSITLQIGRLQETIRIVDAPAAPPAPPRPPLAYTEPPCPAAAGRAGNIGGNLRPPKKLRDMKPDFPPALRGSNADVIVVVDAKIGLDGYLKDLQPREPYDQSAYAVLAPALQQWRFSATLLNCVPQEVRMTITASFGAR